MNDGYVCCFCGCDISKEDYAAVHLIATNLWEREAAQGVYAHSYCAEERMAAGQFSPDALLDWTTGHSVQEIIWGEDEAKRVQVPGWGCFALMIIIVAAAYALIRAAGLSVLR